MMLLNGHHLDNNATFKKLKYVYPDGFLTVINLFYKNLFYHQPFEGLSIIINTVKLFTKKKQKLDNVMHSNNENKDIAKMLLRVCIQTKYYWR